MLPTMPDHLVQPNRPELGRIPTTMPPPSGDATSSDFVDAPPEPVEDES